MLDAYGPPKFTEIRLVNLFEPRFGAGLLGEFLRFVSEGASPECVKFGVLTFTGRDDSNILGGEMVSVKYEWPCLMDLTRRRGVAYEVGVDGRVMLRQFFTYDTLLDSDA